MNRGLIRAAIFLSIISSLSASEHWPHWRGPYFDGTSDSTNLPITWSRTKNVRWSVELPSWSGATPIVYGDRVFVASPAKAAKDNLAPDVKPIRKLAPDGRWQSGPDLGSGPGFGRDSDGGGGGIDREHLPGIACQPHGSDRSLTHPLSQIPTRKPTE